MRRGPVGTAMRASACWSLGAATPPSMPCSRSASCELRLTHDWVVESPSALAPLIDPNVHTCRTVPVHGAEQLAHPDKDFYVVGMKSYGRAPTFLMPTGYEQVRSVAAALTRP